MKSRKFGAERRVTSQREDDVIIKPLERHSAGEVIRSKQGKQDGRGTDPESTDHVSTLAPTPIHYTGDEDKKANHEDILSEVGPLAVLTCVKCFFFVKLCQRLTGTVPPFTWFSFSRQNEPLFFHFFSFIINPCRP